MRMKENAKPGMFGQKHSSRDYTKEANWEKNIFNTRMKCCLLQKREITCHTMIIGPDTGLNWLYLIRTVINLKGIN